jgi:G3E family GTPase
MCCVVRKDIITTVEMLLEKRPDIDYIIVEASGLSDPVPIAQTFSMTMTDTVRLDAIICVVDALNIEKNFANYEIAMNQIVYSDIVLVSKTSMISPERYQEIKFFIKKLSPFMRVFPLDTSLTLDMILDTGKFDHSKINELEIDEHDHDHQHGEACHDEHCDHEHHHHDGKEYHHIHEHVDEIFVKITEQIDLEKFENFIKALPQEVVRGK